MVRDLFVRGTEPTAYDNLYVPFLVNTQSGRLATIYTPLQDVEEIVYLIPPADAQEWAEETGLPRPPREYDPLEEQSADNSQVMIGAPLGFSFLRGNVVVRGSADVAGMLNYRLQYGAGLNPTLWFQIGADVEHGIENSVLGIWDASELNGIYTLQLQVLLPEGAVITHEVLVTLDNQAPQVQMLAPQPGMVFDLDPSVEIHIRAALADESQSGRVDFYVDGKWVGSSEHAPHAFKLELDEPGEYTLALKGFDSAGNQATTQNIVIFVE